MCPACLTTQKIIEVTTGWINYYVISYMKGYIKSIDQWIR
ncbi:group II intron maturase-specific domain-containing protein [Virgibacillus natechei]